jgi:hypothetical protein
MNRARIIGGVIVAWVLFWIVALTIPRRATLDIVNALTIAVGLGIIVAYSKDAFISLFHKTWQTITPGRLLVTGIFLAFIGSVFRNAWSWTWRSLDYPDWMRDHPILSFSLFVIVTGGCFHLLANSSTDDGVPKKAWLRLGRTVAIGVALGILVVYLGRHMDD